MLCLVFVRWYQVLRLRFSKRYCSENDNSGDEVHHRSCLFLCRYHKGCVGLVGRGGQLDI